MYVFCIFTSFVQGVSVCEHVRSHRVLKRRVSFDRASGAEIGSFYWGCLERALGLRAADGHFLFLC